MKARSVLTCRRCVRIRWFLGVAALLIAAIYLQPDWASRMARRMPPTPIIGVGITAAGVVVFARRLHQHIRTQQ